MMTDLGLLVLRLGFASLLIGFHGWARLGRAFDLVVHKQPWTFVAVVERLGFPFPPVFAVASALSESIAVVLIALGVYTRWAALLVAFNFSVAFYTEVHKGSSVELPALYLLGATTIVLLGGGRWSFDGLRGGRTRGSAKAKVRRPA